MIKQSVTIDETVAFLNELLALDHQAITALIKNHVTCNEQLAAHQTVQVLLGDGEYFVEALGILNGLFGIDEDGWGAIIGVLEDDRIVEFEKLNTVW